MLTVSPKRQYLGIACPTTPVYATYAAIIIQLNVFPYFYMDLNAVI